MLEGNGEIKEYDYKNKLIYDGQCFHGEKSGRGNEYDFEGNLVYQGEFFNGKRNGMGTEYSSGDDIKFEGEYLNGQRWNGKEYSDNYYLNDESFESYGKRQCFILNGKQI